MSLSGKGIACSPHSVFGFIFSSLLGSNYLQRNPVHVPEATPQPWVYICCIKGSSPLPGLGLTACLPVPFLGSAVHLRDRNYRLGGGRSRAWGPQVEVLTLHFTPPPRLCACTLGEGWPSSFSIAVMKCLRSAVKGEKGYFWLIVSEALVHDQLALLLWV